MFVHDLRIEGATLTGDEIAHDGFFGELFGLFECLRVIGADDWPVPLLDFRDIPGCGLGEVGGFGDGVRRGVLVLRVLDASCLVEGVQGLLVAVPAVIEKHADVLEVHFFFLGIEFDLFLFVIEDLEFGVPGLKVDCIRDVDFESLGLPWVRLKFPQQTDVV